MTDEARLLEVARDLDALGVRYRLIREPDEPFCGEATAIGVEPQQRTPALKKALGRLQLLR